MYLVQTMRFAQIAKRVLLFAAVNILVLLTISIVLRLLGLDRRLGSNGYTGLMVFCLLWGMGGAFISLAMSRLIPRWSMGVKIIDPSTRPATPVWRRRAAFVAMLPMTV